MNALRDTVIYYKGKIKSGNIVMKEAYDFAVDVMEDSENPIYDINFPATSFGIIANGWDAKLYSRNLHEGELKEFLLTDIEVEDLAVFSFEKNASDSSMYYMRFEICLKEDFIMFIFKTEIAETLDLNKIAQKMREFVISPTEGQIFEAETDFEISGYVLGYDSEDTLKYKEIIEELV